MMERVLSIASSLFGAATWTAFIYYLAWCGATIAPFLFGHDLSPASTQETLGFLGLYVVARSWRHGWRAGLRAFQKTLDETQ